MSPPDGGHGQGTRQQDPKLPTGHHRLLLHNCCRRVNPCSPGQAVPHKDPRNVLQSLDRHLGIRPQPGNTL